MTEPRGPSQGPSSGESVDPQGTVIGGATPADPNGEAGRPRPSPRPRPTPEGTQQPALSESVPAEAGAPDAVTTGETVGEQAASRHWWQRRREPGTPPPKKSLWREIPILIVIALALALLIKTFVVQPFYIPSGSMERTLMVNDRVLVNKMVYDFRHVKRGEIVVFNIKGTGFEKYATPLAPPSNIVARAFRNLENLFGLGPNNQDFIKRVIAVGGDTVACCDAQGRVTVNGIALNEPYVYRNGPDEVNKRFGPVKVPKGYLWVMGDHRNDSEDSRVGGPVPESKVVGQAFVRVWPITQWRGFGVPATFSQLNKSSGSGTSGAPAPTLGLVAPLWWWRRSRRGKRSLRLPVLPARSGAGSG